MSMYSYETYVYHFHTQSIEALNIFYFRQPALALSYL